MIKAGEPRKGNLLFTDTGTPTPIQPAGILAIEQGKLKMKPIPLTPEWLERCGFKILVDDGFLVRVAKGVVCIKISGIGLPVVRIGEMHFTNIIHLHQLQNLYFALTGEELIITL